MQKHAFSIILSNTNLTKVSYRELRIELNMSVAEQIIILKTCGFSAKSIFIN